MNLILDLYSDLSIRPCFLRGLARHLDFAENMKARAPKHALGVEAGACVWLRKADMPASRLRHVSVSSRFQSLVRVVHGDRVFVMKVLVRVPGVAVVDVGVVGVVHDVVVLL